MHIIEFQRRSSKILGMISKDINNINNILSFYLVQWTLPKYQKYLNRWSSLSLLIQIICLSFFLLNITIWWFYSQLIELPCDCYCHPWIIWSFLNKKTNIHKDFGWRSLLKTLSFIYYHSLENQYQDICLKKSLASRYVQMLSFCLVFN